MYYMHLPPGTPPSVRTVRPVCTEPTTLTGGWVLQQQGPAEPAYILSQDNRFLACFEEALDVERNVMIAAPELLTALMAIRARIIGEWDHPALLAFGPLTTSTNDILKIATAAIASMRLS